MILLPKTAGNRTVEKAIYDVRSGIAEGRTMADPLQESGVFPAMVCQMISVGESTGALDAMLEKIADFYDEEVDQAVENLTALIEPFMLVFLGTTDRRSGGRHVSTDIQDGRCHSIISPANILLQKSELAN